MNKFFLSALIPLALCHSASADVNMRDGSFLQTWTDFRLKTAHATYDLKRTYNSRSLHQSIFGFGWCSEIETRITWQATTASLEDCLGVHEVQLQMKDHQWRRSTPNGGFQKFNLRGQLLSFRKSSQAPVVLLRYENNHIQEIQFGKSVLSFHFKNFNGKSNAQLDRIEFGPPTAAPRTLQKNVKKYRFEDGNLIAVQMNSSPESIPSMNYQYDEFHNLEKWTYGKQFFNVTYDSIKDQVQTFESSLGCSENYRFERLSDQILQSSLQRNCPQAKSLSLNRTFRFESAKDKMATQGQAQHLQQVSVSENNRPFQKIRIGEMNDSKDLP